MDLTQYKQYITKWITLASSVLIFLSSPTTASTLLSRNEAPGHIITILPETQINNINFKGHNDSNSINVTFDGVVFTTKSLEISQEEQDLLLCIEYNRPNGEFASKDLMIEFTTGPSHSYLLNAPYYGYVCRSSDAGNTVRDFETLMNDLYSIPSDAKVKLLKGDENVFNLIEEETEYGRQFEIRTQNPTEDNKPHYLTILQVHLETSYVEHAFINVNVQECGNFDSKRVGIPLVQHTNHKRSTRATREDKVFVVNSLSTGDLFT